MNLLVCGFNLDWHEKILNGILAEINPHKVNVISNVRHNLKADGLFWELNDLALCRFEKSKPQAYPAIDATLVEEMSVYEREFIIMQDRLEVKTLRKYNYRQRLDMYYDSLRIVNGIIETTRPDICVLDYIPHLGFDYILYRLLEKKGVLVVMQCYSLSIPFITTSRYFFSNLENQIPELEHYRIDNVVELSDRMKAFLNYYSKDNSHVESFVSGHNLIEKKLSRYPWVDERIKAVYRYIRRLDTDVFRYLRRERILSKVRHVEKKYSYKDDLTFEKYIYFPLQYQPECTSIPQGGVYGDQSMIVQLLSDVLPEGFMLLVKPHPNTSYLTDDNFYRRITSYNNVILLPTETDTYRLIDNACAVVTITGTVAWEAVTRGIPVIMFGYMFYQYAPLVYHVKSRKDCENALDEIINRKEHVEEQLQAFLYELDKYLYEGYMEDEYMSFCKITMEDNINNSVKGYVDFIKNNYTRYEMER